MNIMVILVMVIKNVTVIQRKNSQEIAQIVNLLKNGIS